MTLYARSLTLRNCGRFTVIASDFGADYRTHTHVTSEALYASLTRGATWRAGGTVAGQAVYPVIEVKKDRYEFTADYDLAALPIWFTPGLFGSQNEFRLPDKALDAGYFNVVHEAYPTTSGKYEFKKGELKGSKRPTQVPTYGTWQGILPNNELQTFGLASDPDLLTAFEIGQTYMLGKKRTMMQIVALSEIVEGIESVGACQTGYLQVRPEEMQQFAAFEVLAGTMRYLIARGTTHPETSYFEFSLVLSGLGLDKSLSIPAFFLEGTSLREQ